MAINTPVSGGGGGDVTSAAVVTALDGASSIPDATPVSGDKILFKDTSDSGNLKEMDYDDLPGAGGGLSNIVEDLTPQAGGSFDVNGQEIVSVGGTDIVLHSDNELIIELGDAAGLDSVVIRDSASVEVAAIDSNGNITTSGTVDGRDLATDGTKLDGIETSATADQTDAEIRAAVEAATDSNVFTDADHTKLDGIEASADVTDATNVTAAGALMDSEVTNLSGIKTLTVPDSTTISTFAATLTDDTTASEARTTLGLAIGTDVQAYALVLANTTASFTTGQETKLSNIETAADVTDETNVMAALDGATIPQVVTPAAGDKVLIQDVSDSDNLGYVTYSTFSSGSTVDVVSNVDTQTIVGRNTAGNGDSEELSMATARTMLNVEDGADVTDETNVVAALDGATLTAETPAGTDRFLMLDASDSNNLKVALYSNFSGGGGGGGSFDLANRNDNTTETLTESTATRVSITTATITKTLPALSGVTDGASIAVSLDAVTEGTGSVTISRGSTDTINWGGVAKTSIVLAEDGDTLVLYADTDNSQWRVIHDGIKGPTFIGSRISSNQTYSTSTATKMQWNGETEDHHNCFDNATNYRFTPLIPGTYNVEFTAKLECDAPPAYLRVMLYKNGSLDRWGVFDVSAGNEPRRHEMFQVYLNGSTDYVELYMFNQGTSPFFATDESHIEIRRSR